MGRRPQEWTSDLVGGAGDDKTMLDILRFTRELLGIRTQLPALTGTDINVYHVHNANRILAFHRWIAGKGQDVVVVASLNEATFWDYELGFPLQGYWREVFIAMSTTRG